MEKVLKAKPIVKKIYEELTAEIDDLHKVPQLALISVGENSAAVFYIRNIIKKAEKIGIKVNHRPLESDISQNDLHYIITQYNENSEVDAILIQKPLPKQIDDNMIASAIKPEKDVDGFSPINLGKLLVEVDALYPCTPSAVMTLIDYYGIELAGKHAVLCGRSIIVGKPLLNMLLRKKEPGNATVTVCHSKTKNLSSFTSQADILITALGKPHLIKGQDVKEGAIIIDVGTNEIIENGNTKYVGDVDYDDCFDKATAITPVPGGIGSITTAMLMTNIVKAAKSV